MDLFRELSEEEAKEFRQWARNNYTPHSEIKSIWHPVVVEECHKMNAETMNLEEDDIVYTEYTRIAWPDYQSLMDHPDWAHQTVAIGDSDVLVPAEWVNHHASNTDIDPGYRIEELKHRVAYLEHMLDLYSCELSNTDAMIDKIVKELERWPNMTGMPGALTKTERKILDTLQSYQMGVQARETWGKSMEK